VDEECTAEADADADSDVGVEVDVHTDEVADEDREEGDALLEEKVDACNEGALCAAAEESGVEGDVNACANADGTSNVAEGRDEDEDEDEEGDEDEEEDEDED
jgi:hypothetical protein